MKKILFSSLAIAAALLLNSSHSFAQSITINVDAPILDFYGNEIYDGAAMMLIKASENTVLNGISAPQLGNPFFITGGDEILGLEPGYVNPLPYFAGYIFGYNGLLIDTTGMTPGSTFYVYLRIFDKIAGTQIDGYGLPPSGFDSNGAWTGVTLGPIEDGVFYYDTPLYEVEVNSSFELVINLGTMDDEGFPTSYTYANNTFIAPANAIPEPGMMLLMASGLCWMFTKLRRK